MVSSPRPVSRDHLQNDGAHLDAVNRQLLSILAVDARTSTAELARRVGMSAPAVRERIDRLEQAGVIRGYRVDIDPAKVGLPVAAWVRVRPGPGQLAKVADLAQRSPQVSECHRVTGDDCFVMTAHVRDVEHLEELIDAFARYGQTTTAIMQSSPVPRRGLAMPGG